jgi:hypothetical protein
LSAALLPIFKGSFEPLSTAAAIIIKVLSNLCPPPRRHHKGSFEPLPAALLNLTKLISHWTSAAATLDSNFPKLLLHTTISTGGLESH